MVRQVAEVRNGRGWRKGTLMKGQAELPSWDWSRRLSLTTSFDASLFASYFQALKALRPEPWLHSGPHQVNTEHASNRPLSAPTGARLVRPH